MFQIIHDSLPIIQNSKILKTAFKDTKLTSSKRQSPNLKQILTKAAFSQNKKLTGCVKKCGDKRCKTCPHINVTNEINMGLNQTEFHIKFPFTKHAKLRILYTVYNVPRLQKAIHWGNRRYSP